MKKREKIDDVSEYFGLEGRGLKSSFCYLRQRHDAAADLLVVLRGE